MSSRVCTVYMDNIAISLAGVQYVTTVLCLCEHWNNIIGWRAVYYHGIMPIWTLGQLHWLACSVLPWCYAYINITTTSLAGMQYVTMVLCLCRHYNNLIG